MLALDGVGSLLGPDWVELLDAAVALFGDPYPFDPDTRAALIAEFNLEETLEQLDGRFYDLEASVDADQLLSQALDR